MDFVRAVHVSSAGILCLTSLASLSGYLRYVFDDGYFLDNLR
jgi:hypothetical protein